MANETAAPFNPDWTMAPAVTLREWMRQHDVDARKPGRLAVAVSQVTVAGEDG